MQTKRKSLLENIKKRNKKSIFEKMQISKKGQLTDLLLLPIIIFVTAVSLFFIYFVWQNIQGELSTNLQDDNPDAPAFLEKVSGGLSLFDNLFPLFLVGNIIFLVISAFFIRSYPFFFIIAIIFFVIAIFISIVIANVHQEIVVYNDEFQEYTSEWDTSSWIINRMPIIVVVVGVIVAIALFSKPSTPI